MVMSSKVVSSLPLDLPFKNLRIIKPLINMNICKGNLINQRVRDTSQNWIYG